MPQAQNPQPAADERIKIASRIIIYLIEELGDARLRAAQLKRYVDEATELIEKSPHRDHFFEVAAQLIHGIPQALFKLEKALDASAMAAARLDYEEIRQGLRPEKSDELEEVMEDTRLRYLNRRGKEPVTPKEAAAKLLQFAAETEKSGQVPVDSLFGLIAGLEADQQSSEDLPKKAAEVFRRASKLIIEDSTPSRLKLAGLLRRVLADTAQPTLAANPIFTQAVSREDVMKGFEEQNRDLTKDQLKEIADQWEANKDVVRDKTASLVDTLQRDLIKAFYLGQQHVTDDALNDAKDAAQRVPRAVAEALDSVPWTNPLASAPLGPLGDLADVMWSLAYYMGAASPEIAPRRASDKTASSVKTAGDVDDLVNFVESDLEAHARDRAKLQAALENISERESEWKVWGKDPEGEPFEAVLTVYGSGIFNLYVDTLPGIRMGYSLVPPGSSLSKFRSALRGYTDIDWDLQKTWSRLRLASDQTSEDKDAGYAKGEKADKDKDGVPDNIKDPEAKSDWKAMTEEHGDKFKKKEAAELMGWQAFDLASAKCQSALDAFGYGEDPNAWSRGWTNLSKGLMVLASFFESLLGIAANHLSKAAKLARDSSNDITIRGYQSLEEAYRNLSNASKAAKEDRIEVSFRELTKAMGNLNDMALHSTLGVGAQHMAEFSRLVSATGEIFRRHEGPLTKEAAAIKWDKNKAKQWMLRHINDYVDHMTGEANHTGLAEGVASEFDIYGPPPDYEIPQDLFDLAVDVGEIWERKQKRATDEVAEDKDAGYAKGEKADKDKDGVPDNIKDPEAKSDWKAMTEEHGDKFKKKDAAWKA